MELKLWTDVIVIGGEKKKEKTEVGLRKHTISGQCMEIHVPIVPPKTFKTFKHYNYQEPIRNSFMDPKIYTQLKSQQKMLHGFDLYKTLI